MTIERLLFFHMQYIARHGTSAIAEPWRASRWRGSCALFLTVAAVAVAGFRLGFRVALAILGHGAPGVDDLGEAPLLVAPHEPLVALMGLDQLSFSRHA